jgi:hypothetical protein
MTFEFAVPSGYRPIGLYVKGSRWEVPEGAPRENLADPSERDAQIVARGGVYPTISSAEAAITPVQANNGLGFVIQQGSQRGLEVFSEQSNNWIRNGEETYSKNQIGSGAGMERSLRIDKFEVSPDTVIVKVNASRGSPASLLSEAALSADPGQKLLLVDSNGTSYEPVGFVYKDNERYKVRFTVGRPIGSVQELSEAGVNLSTSRPEQELMLIYRVTFGAELRKFQIGGTVVYEIDPPLLLDQRQR